ncbi:signal peptidase I [Roseibium sp. HPY-6]|uniref:signal peptidase I n=1 Tax=Roseibium sp. HPY-6 TaxID=3229852 RepID=UPI00338EBC5A
MPKLKLLSLGLPLLLPITLTSTDIGLDWWNLTVSKLKAFHIPAGSMKPTLEVGDRLYVHLPATASYAGLIQRDYAAEINVRRGDVVVFKLPIDPSVDYIKRVIGLPGEKIKVVDGVVHIDGEPVKRERIDDYVEVQASGEERRSPRYRETLPNGVFFDTLDLTENGQLDNTREYTVPKGHYFMLGDNRDNSVDSRVLSRVGYIPEGNIVGIANRVYLSGKTGQVVWRSLKLGRP